MWNKIVNPVTGKKVNINSTIGKNIIKNYVYHQNGGGVLQAISSREAYKEASEAYLKALEEYTLARQASLSANFLAQAARAKETRAKESYIVKDPVMMNHIKINFINQEYQENGQNDNKELIFISDIHLLLNCDQDHDIRLLEFIKIFLNNVDGCLDVFIEDGYRHNSISVQGGGANQNQMLQMLPINVVRNGIRDHIRLNGPNHNGKRIHWCDIRRNIITPVVEQVELNNEGNPILEYTIQRELVFQNKYAIHYFFEKMIEFFVYGNLRTNQNIDILIGLLEIVLLHEVQNPVERYKIITKAVQYLTQINLKIGEESKSVNINLRKEIIDIMCKKITEELECLKNKKQEGGVGGNYKLTAHEANSVFLKIFVYHVDIYTLLKMFRTFSDNVCSEGESMTKILAYYGDSHIENYVYVLKKLKEQGIINIESHDVYQDPGQINATTLHPRSIVDDRPNYPFIKGCVEIPINTKILGIIPNMAIQGDINNKIDTISAEAKLITERAVEAEQEFKEAQKVLNLKYIKYVEAQKEYEYEEGLGALE